MNRQLQKEPWAGAGAIHCESPTGMNDSQKREATGGRECDGGIVGSTIRRWIAIRQEEKYNHMPGVGRDHYQPVLQHLFC